jgi:hypothetical protein
MAGGPEQRPQGRGLERPGFSGPPALSCGSWTLFIEGLRARCHDENSRSIAASETVRLAGLFPEMRVNRLPHRRVFTRCRGPGHEHLHELLQQRSRRAAGYRARPRQFAGLAGVDCRWPESIAAARLRRATLLDANLDPRRIISIPPSTLNQYRLTSWSESGVPASYGPRGDQLFSHENRSPRTADRARAWGRDNPVLCDCSSAEQQARNLQRG